MDRLDILLIDGEKRRMSPTVELLRSDGFSVEQITSPSKALKTVKDNPKISRVVILNMAMPADGEFDVPENNFGLRTGFLLLEKLKRLAGFDSPIIATTQNPVFIDELKGKVWAGHVKPFQYEKLRSSISSAIKFTNEIVAKETQAATPLPHPLIQGYPPSWASSWGQDEYGIWLSIRIKDVEQRMRWIPPGPFRMGSPETEEGRDSDEKQHLVTLTKGYWLFDTPVTQALWVAVMSENPSEFQSPDRPVENVSWDDCARFFETINSLKTGLSLRFPTEAEWEYACRAGTTTATYAGDLEIIGENNAPVLDEIAWYGGNSGVDFDLEKGFDSSDWKEKQYDHKQAGTRIVAQKEPNGWGLYDMLGNVYEWCADWFGDYSGKDEIDPKGPEKGPYRVYRGGGWLYYARYVRAASRNYWTPDYRNGNLGFRCVRGQEE